uniref:Uncharacterized protein n=1 Tax=Setaria digitata TaxID=48799 RepID=A0A915PGZ1_9BILA
MELKGLEVSRGKLWREVTFGFCVALRLAFRVLLFCSGCSGDDDDGSGGGYGVPQHIGSSCAISMCAYGTSYCGDMSRGVFL